MADVVTGELADEFLTWLLVEKGRSANTLAAYRRDLDRWRETLSDRSASIETATEDDVIAHVRALQAAGRAPASVARATVAVRALYGYLVAEGRRDEDPTAYIEMPPVPKGLPKPLTADEVSRLLESVSGDDALARRDRAMLELLYGTGIRISELVGTALGDLDRSDALLRVFGKGAKERIVPVGRYAMDALDRWFEPRGRGALEPERWRSRADAEAMWLNRRGGRLSRQGAWAAIKKRGAAVGLGARLSPHVLRHSCATHMIDHGADIRTVQELLGHASVTTTQVYTKVSQEMLWRVYEQAHPRARAR